MAVVRVSAASAMAGLDDWSAVLDARSESEHALDHLPGALNWPVLNDAERASIGTEYVQVSAFAARKRGAALTARNIARHIEAHVLGLPREWRPLVYCWRGGNRSGALATILGQIGFRVAVLEGGYQAWRRALVEDLDRLIAARRLRVVCGLTGSGKSALLQALAGRGEQVLDLEALANHRGSVLGLAPGDLQPSQKAFDTAVWDALRRTDPTRPIWVESESAKVGRLRLPPRLVEAMRAAPCVQLELPLAARVEFLLREYRFFVDDVEAFCERLDALRELRGKAVVAAWQAAAREGRLADVVRDLLVTHYDPVYGRSMGHHFAGLHDAPVARWDGSAEGLRACAASLAERDRGPGR